MTTYGKCWVILSVADRMFGGDPPFRRVAPEPVYRIM